MNNKKKELEGKSITEEELRAYAADLEKKNAFLQKVLDNSFDAIYVTDAAGNPIAFNKAYEEMSGLTFPDVQGLNAIGTEGRFVSKAVTPIAIAERRSVTMEQTLYRTGRKVVVTAKPVFNEKDEIDFVILNIRDISEIEGLRRSLSRAEQELADTLTKIGELQDRLLVSSNIIAQDRKMLDVLAIAMRVAGTDSSVLLTGETGVGKEEVAKYIHAKSRRAQMPFLAVNCGAIPENLIESELFGYERGAFTGARTTGKPGLFETAQGGTVLLDELGELPLEMQVKLLRVLQTQEVTRIGGVRPVHVDVRVLAATNRDLQQMVDAGTFRADLYYRISVVPITIPPLRDRKQDIMPLARLFIEELNGRYGYRKEFSPGAERALMAYGWPGNVRELRNIVERAVILSESDLIYPADFPFSAGSGEDAFDIPEGGTELSELLERIEYSYMEKAYARYGNVRAAAEALGLKRSTFAGRFKYLKEKIEKEQ